MPVRNKLKPARKQAARGSAFPELQGKAKSGLDKQESPVKLKTAPVRSLAIKKALAREKRFESPQDLAEQAGRIARKRRAGKRVPASVPK